MPLHRAQHRVFALTLAVALAGCGGDDGSGGPTDGVPLDCDALLTEADFATVCGAGVTLMASAFEGIALNPCNRSGASGDAIFIVTEHPSANVAASAAEVAGGRAPTPDVGATLSSAGATGIYAVEVKATPEVCASDQLPVLLDLVLGRL